ncbi:hypothetical protein EYF80_029912 [Liparis tanakae]|uniref:Uncharacterized protein n=1 Tax=Liparis tanakae TaxID=230148 RepID=A0A4Z2H444_9TELE|nr:hypothetical protein EYF80_029912 [Liparis tanakae]
MVLASPCGWSSVQIFFSQRGMCSPIRAHISAVGTELKGSGAGSRKQEAGGRRDDGVEAAVSMAGNPKKHPRKGYGVVFQTPEAVLVGRRDFFRRRSDSRRKPTLTPPSMTTPEIRALAVTAGLQSAEADAEQDRRGEGVVVDESTALSVTIATVQGQICVGIAGEEHGAEVDLQVAQPVALRVRNRSGLEAKGPQGRQGRENHSWLQRFAIHCSDECFKAEQRRQEEAEAEEGKRRRRLAERRRQAGGDTQGSGVPHRDESDTPTRVVG